MISLAQRVRDFRYAKGWGPDELASRAEISRTALYQIESGKTGLPRAGTLRRIAVALDVSMDELLGHMQGPRQAPGRAFPEHAGSAARGRDHNEWVPSEGGPLALPVHSAYTGHSQFLARDDYRFEDQRFAGEQPQRPRPALAADPLPTREGDLVAKFQELLLSPLGPGIAKIVDELHLMLPRSRNLA